MLHTSLTITKLFRGLSSSRVILTYRNLSSINHVKPKIKLCIWLAFSLPFKFKAWTFFGESNADVQKLKYWSFESKDSLIKEADRLYEQREYLEVYELLNRFECLNDPNALWRIARALYKLSTLSIPDDIRNKMVMDAYEVITHALELNDDNPMVHKWMAIILNLRYSLEGLKAKILVLEKVKYHLSRAIDLHPHDTTLLHMCGKMSYELADMSWLQRKMAIVIFAEPPTSTYEEAYGFFMQAELISPRFYIGNLLMLGKTAYKLGQYHRARYYYNLAAQMPVYTDEDKEIQIEATKLGNQLHGFDSSINAL